MHASSSKAPSAISAIAPLDSFVLPELGLRAAAGFVPVGVAVAGVVPVGVAVAGVVAVGVAVAGVVAVGVLVLGACVPAPGVAVVGVVPVGAVVLWTRAEAGTVKVGCAGCEAASALVLAPLRSAIAAQVSAVKVRGRLRSELIDLSMLVPGR
jgi:hypothetical protein